MQHHRATRFMLQTAFIAAILIMVLTLGTALSERVPLFVSGPLLMLVVIGIAWRETRA